MNQKIRADIPEIFYRPWNKTMDDDFPCRHCQCRHEVGVEWECPCAAEYGWDDAGNPEDISNELVYIDNSKLTPEWLLTKGYGVQRNSEYRKGEAEYRDGVLSYIPLPHMQFPLFSFELAESPRYVSQYYLRVRQDDIIAAFDFAEEIGELHVLEDIVFDFYEAVIRCEGLRYANLTFGSIVKEYANVVVPIFGKIFRQGGFIYIDMKHTPIYMGDIDDYLGGHHSGEDGAFYDTESTSYCNGNWGFDFIEDGKYVDYIPVCDIVEGDEQCGLLIDCYWLQDGMEYSYETVLHLFTVILDWVSEIWTTADALAVANAIVREIPALHELVVYLKDALVQEIRGWDEE